MGGRGQGPGEADVLKEANCYCPAVLTHLEAALSLLSALLRALMRACAPPPRMLRVCDGLLFATCVLAQFQAFPP